MKTSLFTMIAVGIGMITTGCIQSPDSKKNPATHSEVEQMGKVILSQKGSAGAFNDFIASTGDAPKLTDQSTSGGAQTLMAMAAGWGEGAEDTVTIDSSTLSNGYITVRFIHADPLVRKTGELVIKCTQDAANCAQNPTNVVSLRETTLTIRTQVLETVSIVDLDGDGIANGEPQYNNKAQATFTKSFSILGISFLETSVVKVHAGPDKDFGDEKSKDPAEVEATKDNQILALNWEKKRNGILINTAEYSDADGDGIAYDPKATSNQTVALKLFETGNPFKIFVQSSSLEITLEISAAAPEGKIVKISGEEKMKNGRVNKMRVENTDGTLTIDPNAIVQFVVNTQMPVGGDDSLNSMELTITVDVGSGLEDSTDNKITKIEFHQEAKKGLILSTTFVLDPDEPFLQGTDPKSGTIFLSVTFADGNSFTMQVVFDSNGMKAHGLTPNGEAFDAAWDGEGNLVSLKP